MNEHKRLLIFLIVCISILLLLALYMFRPLVNVLLLGIIFSYLFYPVYKFLVAKTGMKRISSFFVCVLFIVVITVPMVLAINTLTRDVFLVSGALQNLDSFEYITSPDCDDENRFCATYKTFVANKAIKSAVDDSITAFSASLRRYFGNLILQVPMFLLYALIIIFMMYYLLIDGRKILDKLYLLIPIAPKHKDIFFANSDKFLGGILFGSIFVAAIQGILGGLGFFVVGINSPILWGFIMFIFAIVPLVGPVFIWLPAGIILLVTSWTAGDMFGVWKAVGLLLYGAFVVSSIDNILRPKVVSRYTNIHPLLVFLGVFGGIFVFGMAGLIIGPLILGMLMTLISIYESEFVSKKEKDTAP
ncbi:MAG: AI-2E family transporter [Candidatus Woesearchaeota archaeon]